jgi:norsolorinic acid ketoreductase
MGNKGARAFGLEQAPESLDDSCDGMMKLFDAATKESHGGKFWHYHGEQESW